MLGDWLFPNRSLAMKKILARTHDRLEIIFRQGFGEILPQNLG